VTSSLPSGLLDAEFLHIIGLSLAVSLTATAWAAPLGAALALWRFPGRRMLILGANALLGLPPVVVGLALYLSLSRSGVFGFLGILFTPAAMMIAQAALALPIITALTHRAAQEMWTLYGEALMDLGATKRRALPVILAIGRVHVLTAVLAGFGRTISEVGAIMIVGGNIAGYTRTMTTAIALETSRGDLPLALGLGLVLIGLSMLVSSLAFALAGRTAA
jgi:tungstate transport system permease protein